MMPRWTEEQTKAINTEGKNIIVSAGAGSGKTAVLSARVLKKTHINNLLILTFTKAAAREMKERIKHELEKEGLIEEVEKLEESYITTFDSFSLSLVKKYYYVLGISRDIKVSDEVLLDILKRNTLDEIINEYYKKEDERFLDFACRFSLRDDKDLLDTIIKLSDKLDLKYDKVEYLENYMKEFFSDEMINRDVGLYIESIKNTINEIIYLKNDLLSSLAEREGSKLEDALSGIESLKDYDDIKLFFNDRSLPRANNYTEEERIMKDSIKKLIDELKEKLTYQSKESMFIELKDTYSDNEILVEILKELNKRYTKLKRDKKLYNFNDIAHLAIKLVRDYPQVREEIKKSFNEILIDEYQDTSDTQEKLISMISDNNVYMVGDIKQSIYRFRNANPYIFKNKYDKYSSGVDGYKIDLNKNFRSRGEVLNNINSLFSPIMDNDIGGANYKEEHLAIFGNLLYEKLKEKDQNYDVDIYAYKKDEEKKMTNIEQEIFIIAEDIKEKMSSNYKIFDKDENILREVRYDDFAILLDTKTNFDLYKKIFEYLNIPLTVYKEETINNMDDFLVIHNLLKLVFLACTNNFSKEFIYTYTSIARSYLFNISDDIIYEDIKEKHFKQTEIVRLALSIKNKLDVMSPSEFYNTALETFNFYDKILTTTDIENKEKCLEYLDSLIKDLEENNYNIEEVIYYLDRVIEQDYTISYDRNINNTSSVKIMTIHKSKGLEFPICYFANLEKKFSRRDLSEKIPISNDFGILVPLINNEFKKTIRNTLYIEKENTELISERIRLFYVALTRCREQIIIVCPEGEDFIEYNSVPKTVRKRYSSFYSIIKSIWPKLLDYVKEKTPKNYTRNYLYKTKIEEIKNKTSETLIVNEQQADIEEIQELHFSKTVYEKDTKEEKEMMEFGTKMHEVLEHIDFKNPKLDVYNLNSFMESKINKFLSSDIIKNNLDAKFYKEYEFVYVEESNEYHGIIDLMIESIDEIIIIDYKLKNISDENYKKQLNGYKMYIEKLTKKKVSTYLYSIMDSVFKEVS